MKKAKTRELEKEFNRKTDHINLKKYNREFNRILISELEDLLPAFDVGQRLYRYREKINQRIKELK